MDFWGAAAPLDGGHGGDGGGRRRQHQFPVSLMVTAAAPCRELAGGAWAWLHYLFVVIANVCCYCCWSCCWCCFMSLKERRRQHDHTCAKLLTFRKQRKRSHSQTTPWSPSPRNDSPGTFHCWSVDFQVVPIIICCFFALVGHYIMPDYIGVVLLVVGYVAILPHVYVCVCVYCDHHTSILRITHII